MSLALRTNEIFRSLRAADWGIRLSTARAVRGASGAPPPQLGALEALTSNMDTAKLASASDSCNGFPAQTLRGLIRGEAPILVQQIDRLIPLNAGRLLKLAGLAQEMALRLEGGA